MNTVELPQNLIEGVGQEEPDWLATVLPPAGPLVLTVSAAA
jgi:hypothetical protein